MIKKIMSRKLNKKNNKGMTLVEMIVCFALLSIFVTVSTLVISNVITLYYHVRGESYARQVGDIVMKKITSEISGAVYVDGDTTVNPSIETEPLGSEDMDGNAFVIVDSTDTKIRMYAEDGILKIYYYEITDENDEDNNREPVIWTFDKKMYNGYKIDSLVFEKASADYPANVMVVKMKLSSGKYGKFDITRYVKMYNVPE
ncbi:MAG TPA: hypothetical protein DEO87_04055 [Lachnospiraceae bacterium]|nr:hypothetical protein [Lachnospiraceae bacterium]